MGSGWSSHSKVPGDDSDICSHATRKDGVEGGSQFAQWTEDEIDFQKSDDWHLEQGVAGGRVVVGALGRASRSDDRNDMFSSFLSATKKRNQRSNLLPLLFLLLTSSSLSLYSLTYAKFG